jgi:hypothetical protein
MRVVALGSERQRDMMSDVTMDMFITGASSSEVFISRYVIVLSRCLPLKSFIERHGVPEGTKVNSSNVILLLSFDYSVCRDFFLFCDPHEEKFPSQIRRSLRSYLESHHVEDEI